MAALFFKTFFERRKFLRRWRKINKRDMAFGFTRLDHFGFVVFPRAYSEIMRGRKIMTEQQNTIKLQMVTIDELVARLQILEGENK